VNRVVVTGMGVVSPLGNDIAATFDALVAMRSAIRRLEGPGTERLVNRLGAPVMFDPQPHFDAAKLRMLDRVSQFALVAAAQALAQSGGALEGLDPRRAGTFVGTGMGGSETNDDGYYTLFGQGSDRLKPFTVLMAMNNAAAAWIGLDHKLEGPNLTYSTACSSSTVAVGEAARRIASGEIDVAIAGGAEAPLTFGTMKAWEALKTLATEDPADRSWARSTRLRSTRGRWRRNGSGPTIAPASGRGSRTASGPRPLDSIGEWRETRGARSRPRSSGSWLKSRLCRN